VDTLRVYIIPALVRHAIYLLLVSVLDHGARNESRIRIIRLASSTSNLLWSASYKPRFPSEATTRSLFHPAKALTGKSVACLLIKPFYYFYVMSQRNARRFLAIVKPLLADTQLRRSTDRIVRCRALAVKYRMR
jgi:hypothetical protein